MERQAAMLWPLCSGSVCEGVIYLGGAYYAPVWWILMSGGSLSMYLEPDILKDNQKLLQRARTQPIPGNELTTVYYVVNWQN